jgi:membrane protein YdbS with pleckstrin-like domain
VIEQRVIRPDKSLLIKYYIYLILPLFFLMLFGLLLTISPSIGWIFMFIYTLANAIWVVPAAILMPLYYRSIEYEMGEEELVVRRGIITKSEATVPYRMVTNIDVKRGPLDRLLGIGGLHIHTAGYSGQQSSAEATLVGLRDYEGVLVNMRAALHRYRARTGPAVGVDEVEELAGAPTDMVLREILAELRALRRHMEQS